MMNLPLRSIVFMLFFLQVVWVSAQSKHDGFCKFTLGDSQIPYQNNLKKSQGPVDGVEYYRYTGILCQSYFGMDISYLELRFKDEKLFHIKTSSYLTSGQVEIFADEAIKEYGKPDAIQKEDDIVISKRIWNGTNTWISLTVNKSDGDSYPTHIEVSYSK